eukprot:4554905-Prorocentrum_lima.AAC.1
MTSSLVGSEMCIRDRSLFWYPARFRVGSFDSLRLYRPGDAHVIVYGAVSYTHLTLPTICSV